jgi:hypothetical protein
LTIEDQAHNTSSVKSENIHNVRQNNVSKGSHTGKVKMIKMIIQMLRKCPLEMQSMERAKKM